MDYWDSEIKKQHTEVMDNSNYVKQRDGVGDFTSISRTLPGEGWNVNVIGIHYINIITE